MTGRLRAMFSGVVAQFAEQLAARPKNQPLWRCPKCGTWNEAGRSYCMNGCSTAGPLAPKRALT